MTDQFGDTFDEAAALDRLKRLREQILQARQQRARALEEFDRFLIENRRSLENQAIIAAPAHQPTQESPAVPAAASQSAATTASQPAPTAAAQSLDAAQQFADLPHSARCGGDGPTLAASIGAGEPPVDDPAVDIPPIERPSFTIECVAEPFDEPAAIPDEASLEHPSLLKRLRDLPGLLRRTTGPGRGEATPRAAP
jgi:hypothetical protein